MVEEFVPLDARPQRLEEMHALIRGGGRNLISQRKMKGCSLVRRQVQGDLPHHH